jgi:hypothetical protein
VDECGVVGGMRGREEGQVVVALERVGGRRKVNYGRKKHLRPTTLESRKWGKGVRGDCECLPWCYSIGERSR